MQTTRASLLLRIKDRRDDTAWRQFDEIYRPMLYHFALSRGLKDAEAEDVVQYCMAAVQEQIHAFDYDPTKGRFKGWLRTLVNNRIRNLLRGKHEQPAESGVFQRPADQETPEEEFDRLWMVEHLKHALRAVQAEVGDTAFQIFQLYVMEQQPVEEICSKLSVNANQVHKTKFRLTKKLAEKLAELGEETAA
ncbi:MAG TPA: sigma-70 family RNA polymerase sigma factor [Phycisphaerae bacterium]|nr:sigma-70 family RNA polymerase sigma factor [Phycisphaerae bacterium]